MFVDRPNSDPVPASDPERFIALNAQAEDDRVVGGAPHQS